MCKIENSRKNVTLFSSKMFCIYNHFYRTVNMVDTWLETLAKIFAYVYT